MTDKATTKIILNKEYAALVPPQTKEEYKAMKQSIKEIGLLNPLLRNQNGVLLDGYHRFKACKELGISPAYKIINTKNKHEENLFVIDSNLKRRQLNNFRKAQLALKAKPIFEEIAKRNMSLGGKGSKCLEPLSEYGVNEQIGKLAGVSHETIRKVEHIQESLSQYEEEEIIKQKLESGESSIESAYRLVSPRSTKLTIKPNPNLTDEEKEERDRLGEELDAYSWLDAYAKMNMSLHALWKAFTNGQKDRPPRSREDTINDYIKPNREFRRRVIFELIETQLLISHNDLIATNQMISDTIRIYQEAIDKTETQ